jgi:N utilization substance protein B
MAPDESETERPRGQPIPRRRFARLAAAQALYQIEMTGRDPDRVVEEFEHLRLADVLGPDRGGGGRRGADRAWFAKVVNGAWAAHERLDPAIEGHLSPGWTMERSGYPFRACLRAGAYELAECPEVPTAVVINEYLEVAHALLPGDEPSVVNAVLDRLARELRPAAAG